MVDESITIKTDNALPQDIAPVAWIDIFYSMLLSPIRTLNVLSNPGLYTPGFSALLGAVLIVVLCALAKGSVGAYSSTVSELSYNIIGASTVTVLFWITLAVFLRLIAALMRVETSIRVCFLVTGWAFIPLVFKAVAGCFANATIFGDIFSSFLSAWFLLLELFAFDCVLKFGRFKTLGVVLIVPPLLYFTYFLFMIFVGVLLCDNLF